MRYYIEFVNAVKSAICLRSKDFNSYEEFEEKFESLKEIADKKALKFTCKYQNLIQNMRDYGYDKEKTEAMYKYQLDMLLRYRAAIEYRNAKQESLESFFRSAKEFEKLMIEHDNVDYSNVYYKYRNIGIDSEKLIPKLKKERLYTIDGFIRREEVRFFM